jgi:hypothetical protein
VKLKVKVHNPAKDAGLERKEPAATSFRWEFEPQDFGTKSTYHKLWAECHTKQDATAEWFADWLNRVPCSVCKRGVQKILEELGQPDFANWFEYSVRLHNAVNRKLLKPELSLDEARTIWQ